MTTITILPEETNYRAVAGRKESIGRTIGEAIDKLTAQLSEEESGTMVVIQNRRADKFFDAFEQKRLMELTEKRKLQTLSGKEEIELEKLVEVELNGAKKRAEEMLGGLKP